MALAIAAFYHEPRLIGVTAVVAAGFRSTPRRSASALLQRQMRFGFGRDQYLGLVVGTAIAIGGARQATDIAPQAMTVTMPCSHNRLLDGQVLGSGRPHRGSV
jgi:hypothetical protein